MMPLCALWYSISNKSYTPTRAKTDLGPKAPQATLAKEPKGKHLGNLRKCFVSMKEPSSWTGNFSPLGFVL